ncbi:MAG: ATP-binding cassette domain-containing protein [Phycisphaeraceae bacterium]|nr:ATP-binding cassette domain-containing protein [Phycisphaeraceae bacterium]
MVRVADNAVSDPGSSPILRVRGVRKAFDGREVLKGIDLDVMPGEAMVIMGGSGSGKSTLLRLMIGSLHADSGSIELFGQNICGLNDDAMNKVRLKFGILFQSGALFNSMTVAENVALPLQEHTRLSQEVIDIQVKIKLEQVQLREAADLYPAQISGGMKKRAGLARALTLDPKLLFCDEPSAGLDPVTSAQIDRLLLDLTKKIGIATVVVTHEMDSAFTIADRMAMLDKGRMLAVEPKAWFDRVRGVPDADSAQLSEDERLIRQFLRGSAEGPLSERQSESDWEQDILGVRPGVPGMPSIEPSRIVPRTEGESVLQRLRRILRA